MDDKQKERGRKNYKNLNISRTKKEFFTIIEGLWFCEKLKNSEHKPEALF